tara:strand:- start:697 stop:939 length:243 start_codon:yes stop_codon:yes gene_type:complete
VSKIEKLTPDILKNLVLQEKKKIITHVDDAVEDAWAGGKNLVSKIDYIKKLGIQEAKLRKALSAIQKRRKEIKESIIREL